MSDGFKLREEVGFGVDSRELNLNFSRRLLDLCIVSKTEIFEIQKAVSCLRLPAVSTTTVDIYTNSRAEVMTLNSPSMRYRAALNCRSSQNKMAEQFDFRMIWVPGHGDVLGHDSTRLGNNFRIILDWKALGISARTSSIDCRYC